MIQLAENITTSDGCGSLPLAPGSPPFRVQLSRRKGWRMPPNTVKVCRPGKFGNPFVVGVDGTAAECVEKFAMDIYHPNGRVGFEVDDVATLRGKNLACWCKIGAPCHADVLLDLANTMVSEPGQNPAKSGDPAQSTGACPGSL